MEEIQPRAGSLRRFSRVFFGRRVVVFGLAVILILIVTAIFAPFIAPYDPYKQDRRNTLSMPDAKHLLGTDTLGRDTFSRIIYGSRSSLLVGIVAIFLAARSPDAPTITIIHGSGIVSIKQNSEGISKSEAVVLAIVPADMFSFPSVMSIDPVLLSKWLIQ